LKRGMKRKFPTEFADPSVQDDYQRGLSDFQTAARKRESMRLRNTIHRTTGLAGSDPAAGNGASWEESLVDKIGLEQKVVEGSSKFLGACKSLQERLEAAKTLQLSKLRIDMLKYELNKHRKGRGSPHLTKQQGRPSYGGVSLSDIRIPLVWRPTSKDVLNNEEMKRAHNFAIFCIARIGSQIYDTSLVHPVDDLACADVTLTDVIEFNRLAPHFEMTLEIYSHALDAKVESSSGGKDKDATMTSSSSSKLILETPQKIAKSISRSLGRKLAKDMDATGNGSDASSVKGPKFEMIASVTLTLDECNEEIQTHELYVYDPSSPTCPSLFGQICCRMAAKPYCCEEEVLSGQIGLVKSPQSSGKVQPHLMWSRLMDWKLSLWNDLSHKESARKPAVDIPVNRDTHILEKGDNCIKLTNEMGDACDEEEKSGKTWELVFDDKETKDKYLVHLFQHAADHRRWKRAALTKMALMSKSRASATNIAGNSWLGNERNVPLYESIVTKKKRRMATLKRSATMKRPAATLTRSATIKQAKSFKRTRSKLALVYNQTGAEDENDDDEENQQSKQNQVLI